MNAPGQQDRRLDLELARIESTAAARPTRVLATAATCAVIIGALALALDWRTVIGDEGVAVRVGWSAAPSVVAVAVVAALLLLAIAWWRTATPVWSGWAAAASAIAALACIGGIRAGAGEHTFSGPAGWIGTAAFGAAAVLASLACLESRTPRDLAPRVPDKLLESTMRRIKIASADEPLDTY
jgi:hypothetical protein